jgi:UDP:flavonoid glycosyltransferase YjiC (YdhE family)
MACAGFPAVLVPRGDDQFMVAGAAVAAGGAVCVLPAELEAGYLGRALDRVASDRDLAASAAELRRVAARYDAPAAAVDVLESWVGT